MPELPKSFVQIVFADVGSVVMVNQQIQATPMQVLALAEYLQFIGKNGLMQEYHKQQEEMQQKAQQNKILTPGMELPNDVFRKIN